MKKRMLPLILALALCLGLAVPAFAADEDTAPKVTCHGPENSGILLESKTESYKVRNFTKGASGDTVAVLYASTEDVPATTTLLVPVGVDITVTGVKSAEDVVLAAWSSDGEDNELYWRLFMLEPGKSAYVAPFADHYLLPVDGPEGTGNPTAAQLGFDAVQDGTITFDSDWLYEQFEVDTLLRVTVGEENWILQLSGEPTLISSIFTDVDAVKWYTDPVAWARQAGIAAGTTSTAFSPDDNCTQAQILTFLYRAARGEGEATAEDMVKAIAWANEKGMIDDSFESDKPCTRSTAVSYIWQAFGKPSAEASSFTDVDASADYAGAVSWAVAQKITTGSGGGKFSPDEICTRGHIATFLYRAYN